MAIDKYVWGYYYFNVRIMMVKMMMYEPITMKDVKSIFLIDDWWIDLYIDEMNSYRVEDIYLNRWLWEVNICILWMDECICTRRYSCVYNERMRERVNLNDNENYYNICNMMIIILWITINSWYGCND